MAYEDGAYRQPYRHGDYHLVDTRHQGTYWQCADGMVVRLASSECEDPDGDGPGVDADAAVGR
jgi:hypothetical protein